VDDDPCVREALSAALSDSYVVHTAATGADACDLLGRWPVLAIVLDAVLEQEDGLELIARFRALSPAAIIILTGHGSEQLAARAVRAHADDYLKKPVDFRELREAVARLAPPGRVDAARHLLDACPRGEIAPYTLAAEVGVSERHLRRQFRLAQGMTPRRYQIEIRLRRAAELLRTTDLTVEEIAALSGYTDVRRFRRHFRAWAGQTPSVYRQPVTPPPLPTPAEPSDSCPISSKAGSCSDGVPR
jgi:AraC-like DNA-binding protein